MLVFETRLLRADERERLAQFISRNPLADTIAAALHAADGRVFLVGGGVRDLMLGREIKDIDVEVHGLALERLIALLKQYGEVFEVGKAFGVLRLSTAPLIDWSLPRSDGAGRHPRVAIDPQMGIADALRRRDLTMNALAIDMLEYELIDPFGGLADMQEGRLRCIDPEIFIEDPLRLFRVMQFIGRFGMEPDELLNETCRAMDIRGVSRERIEDEVRKLLLLSLSPSHGIRWLRSIGRLDEIMPEVAATVGVHQNPRWHPEGDVFEHTMQVLDAAAAETREFPDDERLLFMYAAICHDLGKAKTTSMEKGRLTSHGHEVAGVPLTQNLLHRLVGSKELIKRAALLVRYHMSPGSFVANGAKPPAYKRLARALAPHLSLALLARFFSIDRHGRNPDGGRPLTGPLPDVDAFIERAAQIGVLHGPEEPVVQGRDLKDCVEPGPVLGTLVRRAYELQINEGMRDKQRLIDQVLREARIFVKR
ncbi:MAG: HD domain-containing protein [Candidatus Dependentiae bacterium]|nr:HD domain-containing protein [Candidatus Dependentiae bacterium]